MKTNKTVKSKPIYTHEGAPANHINAEKELRRSVMSCLLFEREFYEDGIDIAERIKSLLNKVKPEIVSEIAIEARTEMYLRHIPLYIVKCMAGMDTHKQVVAKTLEKVIQRADELAEFLSLYFIDGKCPISAQVKKGLAKAFENFNEYDFGKYKGNKNKIKLRDVMFLVHPKPQNKAQEKLFKKIAEDKLAIPETWETVISACKKKDKSKKWKRLLVEKKLGGLAMLRNLRNFQENNVPDTIIKKALMCMNTDRILPYRFIAASKYAPQFEDIMEDKMFECLEDHEKLAGKTILLIDVSGSMDAKMSEKSDLSRIDAANGLAMLLREICEEVVIYSFSANNVLIPNRRGFALRDAIYGSQTHGSTYLGAAVEKANSVGYDRLIAITDEQSHDRVPNPNNKAYMINVASAQHGVGYSDSSKKFGWTHIDGFSESVVKYICEFEKEN